MGYGLWVMGYGLRVRGVHHLGSDLCREGIEGSSILVSLNLRLKDLVGPAA